MARSRQITRIGRWSLVVAALLVGAALLATIWSTNRNIANATDTLTRGQSLVLVQGIRSQLRGLQAPATKQDLEEIVAELSEQGLVYIAVVDPETRTVTEGGTPPGDRDQLLDSLPRQRRPPDPVEIDGRIRVIHGRIGRPGRRRRGPMFVVEFTPKLAAGLEDSAGQSLQIGVLAVVVLLLAALGLVRWLSRRDAIERELEHGKRLASLGQMSAVLAHEIRNPLASLKGNAQLLQRSLSDDEKAEQRAKRVVDEAIRLEDLTNDLLEFAREGQIEREDVELPQLLRGAAESHDPERIELDIDRAPATWSLDVDRIRQVLANLLENALGASDEPVSLTAARVRGDLEIVVRDRGEGIAEADLDKLFEPFFTRKTRGTGLGLAVVKRIVDLHGGTITAANAEGGGAEFRVTIPRI